MTTPRIVNAQRMGAKLHLCVEDVRSGNGNSVWQRCACGGRIVQSDEIAIGHWRAEGLEARDFCPRCWVAYQALLGAR